MLYSSTAALFRGLHCLQNLTLRVPCRSSSTFRLSLLILRRLPSSLTSPDVLSFLDPAIEQSPLDSQIFRVNSVCI